MAPFDKQEETEGRRSTIKPPPLAEPVEKPKFNLWQTVKKSAGEIWDTAQNHKGKIAIAALITVVTGGAAAGVMAGIAGVLVAAKVTKDIAVNYGEAHPESKVGQFTKVAKSISHSLGNIWETIKNNQLKAAALVGGAIVATIATGGVAGIVAGVAALVGVATKVGYDVYKDQKAGGHDQQVSPKNIQPPLVNPTRSQVPSRQEQQEISSLKAQLTEQAAMQTRMQAQMTKMAAMQGTTRVSEYSSVTSSTTPANPQQRPKSSSREK